MSNGKKNAIAASISATVSACITCPLEVVQTRLQSSENYWSKLDKSRISFLNVHRLLRFAVHMVRMEGPASLYRGLTPNLVGTVPLKALYFGCYSSAQNLLGSRGYLESGSIGLYTTSALISGVLCATLANPFWFVRTRLQLETARHRERYGLAKLVQSIYRRNGMAEFFRGTTASYVGVLETVVFFGVYEQLKRKQQAVPSDDISLVQISSAAVASKWLSTLLLYPHEVVRTRMREDRFDSPGRLKYRTFFQTLFLVAKEEGLVGLYRGLDIHLIRQIPTTALYFVFYERIVLLLNLDNR